MTATDRHIPVLLAEVLQALAPRDGGLYIDGTFGAGGYSRAILDAADCRVWAIDRDPAAIARGQDMAAAFSGRLTLIEGCFGDMANLVAAAVGEPVDGVALDIGVSSPQIDDATRGFSFREDGPLDMRMAQDGMSAADVVNETSEKDLADIIFQYGEERAARAVARAIVAARGEAPIMRTLQLADIVRRVVRKSKDGIDPATRTFQGLRIHVNDELGELRRGLAGAERILAPVGRLAVVAFHSLEDRAVKTFLRDRSNTGAGGSRHLPLAPDAQRVPTFKLIERKPIRPGPDELRLNARSRSARLRVAERTAAAAAREAA